MRAAAGVLPMGRGEGQQHQSCDGAGWRKEGEEEEEEKVRHEAPCHPSLAPRPPGRGGQGQQWCSGHASSLVA